MRSSHPTGSPISSCRVAEPAVVLASGSPRRLELLRRLGIEPSVRPADIDESLLPGEAPDAHVARLAEAKADAIARGVGGLVIAADTVVVLDGEVLGKPIDHDDASAMLRRLSGRDHWVLTGVAVRHDGRRAAAVEATEVRFRPISDDEIAAYVATGEPLDKAGAYGIQGAGGMFVDGIRGSDSNVIGLPLATLVRLAADVGVTILAR